MQEVKVRLEFLLVDIKAIKDLVFTKTEEELKNNTVSEQINYSEKYYAFCCIEASLLAAKNYAQKFLDKYGENTKENNDEK